MSLNRVQKLLFSEYCDFEDLVLIESPFAQTTKEGTGVRQVHLGLTPSKLILATDVLPPISVENVLYNPFVDPEIETFELIAIYPVECVNLSVYRKRKRQALKARFCNNRVLYFELGGFEKRGMFWNLWCEKVKFLCPPGNSGTSRSETSVATSTTGSSLYLIDKRVVTLNGIRQLWCKFGPNFQVDSTLIKSTSQSLVSKWTDKYIYLGHDLVQSPSDYTPMVTFPHLKEFVKPKKKLSKKPQLYPTLAEQKQLTLGDSVQVNRFGSGVFEGCHTGLYLTFDDYGVPQQCSSTVSGGSQVDWHSMDLDDLAETAVVMWEYYGMSCAKKPRKCRHRRRYGFAPQPLFLYGLGPWPITKGDRTSLHLKRALSLVNLRPLNLEKTLQLPVSKRQLLATVSCPVLNNQETRSKMNNIINAPKKPAVLFWTPGYWYRPVSARDAYKELQKHLKKLRKLHELKFKSRKYHGRRFLRKFSQQKNKDSDDDEVEEEKRRRKHSFLASMLGVKFEQEGGEEKQPGESAFHYLKRMLKIDIRITVWEFDSTTLAQQLTMVDKELFLKVTSWELGHVMWQQSVKNAPNVAAMIAFSSRINCLIASEVLRNDSERVRARLIARFINVANKCHRLANFHSCRSVLGGLQSPSIYRLTKTWAYVRKKHSSKYEAFEFLCRLYRDPRMPSYQKTFYVYSQNPPYMPYLGHLIAKLLDKVPQYRIQTLQRPASKQWSFCTTKSLKSTKTPETPSPTLLTKILNVFSRDENHQGQGDAQRDVVKRKPSKLVKFKGLYEYFGPLECDGEGRRANLEAAVDLLEKSQLGAVGYDFPSDRTARDFLLKARHFDDQDNFINSLCLELPFGDSCRSKNV